MKGLFLSLITSFVFAPSVYNAGGEFAMQYVNRAYSDLNFSNINASYDLRLLYGDTNNDSKISADEYANFDFSSIDIKISGF